MVTKTIIRTTAKTSVKVTLGEINKWFLGKFCMKKKKKKQEKEKKRKKREIIPPHLPTDNG